MKRAGALWMLPLLLGVGAAAWADERSPVPAPDTSSRPRAISAASSEGDAISLELKEVRGSELSAALGEALGMPVRVDGYILKPVTLKLEGVTRADALAQIATTTGGEWRRVIAWKSGARTASRPKSSERKIKLALTKAPCSTAAAIVAARVGAQAEGCEAFSGRVTLPGHEMPVEEALEAIATQARATWREMMVLRMPNFVARSMGNDPSAAGRPSSRTPFRSGRPRRTKYTVLAKYGAKAPPPVIRDPKVEEERARLGAFAGIFSADTKSERLQRVRRLRAALETQNRRLDGYRPEHRGMATGFEIQQLESLMNDYENLDEPQKKEVTLLVDYVKKRLEKIRTPAVPGTAALRPADGE